MSSSPASPEAPAPRRGKLLRAVGVVVAVVIVAWLVRRLVADWASVRAYEWTLRPWYLAAGFVCLQLAFVTMARAWRSVLRAIGVRWSLTRAFWVFYLSNLGRYIPGNLWQMGAAAMMGRQMGVAATDIVASMIVHLLYFLPVGAVMALATGRFPAPFDGTTVRVLAWSLALVSAAFALWPHVALRRVERLALRVGLDPERWRVEWSRRLAILAQTVVAWVFLSLGFAWMVLGVAPVQSALTWDLARVYMVAHIIGYIVLVAPAGLGVREGTMVFLLSPLLGTGPAAGVALLARLWYTLAELVTVAAAAVCLRRDKGALAAVKSGATRGDSR